MVVVVVMVVIMPMVVPVSVSMAVACMVMAHKNCADEIQGQSDTTDDEHQLWVLDS